MRGSPPALVWYVSYGSNLHRARFSSYLEGGRMPGGLRADHGCRDPSPPLADAALHLDLPLYFSGESRVWGGGVAFLDLAANQMAFAQALTAQLVPEFEKMLIDNTMRRHKGSITAVMDELCLPRRTLNEKMAKYGLQRQDYL